MVSFPIDVTINPQPAQRGAAQVGRSLDNVEREAQQLRRAIAEALAVRDRGTAAALGRIEQALNRTSERAATTDARLDSLGRGINTRGVERLEQSLARVENRASRIGSALRTAFAGLSVALAVRQYAQLSDEAQRVENQIRTVTASQAEANERFDDLVQIAQRTRTDLAAIAQLYQRGSLAAQELGTSQERLLLFTERVGQALAVQGTSATAARGALTQLSQALGSSIVRAEEFNSIMEGAFPIVQAAARGIDRAGGSVVKLRQLVITGQVTNREFFEGILLGTEETQRQFEQTESTIGQSLTNLRTSLQASLRSFNETTGASSALAAGINALGDNLGAVTVTATAMTIAIGGPAAIGRLTAAITANNLLNASAARVVATYTLGAAAVFGFYTQLTRWTEDLTEAEKVRQQSEKDAIANRNALGTQLEISRRELERYQDILAEGGSLTEAQARRMETLERGIAATTQAIRGNVEANREAIRAAQEAAEKRQAEQEAIERQAKLLQDIRNPFAEYTQLQRDLGALLAQNKISQEEFNRTLEASRPAELRPVEDPFAQQLESLRLQNEELAIRATNLGISRDAMLIDLQLQRQGRTLTREEKDALIEVLSTRQQIVDAARARTEADREAAALARDQQRRVDRLRQELDIAGQLAQEEADLLRLREQEAALIPQIDQALLELRTRQLEASNALGDGFERAFLQIRAEAENLAAVGEQVVGVFADHATDAIAEFVSKGKLDFREFANSLLADLGRILARLLVVQSLSAAFGAFGGGGGAIGNLALNAGRQHGGTVQPGQRPMPINEDGRPELFVPDRTGTIVPNAANVQQPAPQVNLGAVVVQDPSLVPQALASGDADEVLIVRVGAMRERMRQVLGIS